jgi:two-component system, LytTR family, sensor kinase
MNQTTRRLTALLSGTHPNPQGRAWLHLAFWLLAFLWFYQQAHWAVGDFYPKLTGFVAIALMTFALVFFYAVSFGLSPRMKGAKRWVFLVLLLIGVYVGYGLFMYFLYNFLSTHYAGIPAYVRNLAAATAQEGPWTFLQEPNVAYFHIQQLLMGLLVPLVVKGLRSVVRANSKALELEKDNLKLELEFLRSQINPHFLFNTLNNVYALVEDKDQTAASVVYSLSNIMRFALYEANTPEVEVSKELETIQNYLAIQEVRHSRRLALAWDISPQLGQQLIPPLLLLSFVENAIKHGVDKYINQSIIAIKAHHDAAGAFCFMVVNSLPPQKAQEMQEGIGIRNTRRRLDLLYPARHTLDIKQTENEYSILLRIW